MLLIALSDKEPPETIEFEKVKNEMGRLSFVGESIINLCLVMTMILSGEKSLIKNNLDVIK